MLKMIIADDEQIIRESISSQIPWNSLGIEVVGCCKNGLEALETILDKYPDIVMTDIRMPGFTGLELIEKIQQIDRDIQFIILSGYREFEFAQQALHLGVKHYLLKPLSETQIIEAVTETKKECLSQHSIRQILQTSREFRVKMEKAYRKQLIYELFSPGNEPEQTVADYRDLLGLEDSGYRVCFFSFLEERFLTEFAQRWYRFLKGCEGGQIVDLLYVKNTAVAVLKNGIPLEKTADFAAGLHFPGESVSVSLQTESYPSFERCAERLLSKLTRYQKILLVDDECRIQEICNYTSFFLKLDGIACRMIAMARENDRNTINALLDRTFSEISDIGLMHAFGASLISSLVSRTGRKQTAGFAGMFDDIYLETEPDRIKKVLSKSVFTLLFPDAGVEDGSVEKVKAYVSSHLGDPNLSLKWIAENYLYMNVDYLSRLFAAKTGEKFSSYLNRTRISRAKELLLRYDADRIYTVAERVGCGNNPRYFGQIFKKYTGMTPSKYIESVKAQAE